MEFTYRSYTDMIGSLLRGGYHITDYHNWNSLPAGSKCAILRHDIDFDIKKAVSLAEIEKDMGVCSTYFVLITSPMYNALSRESCRMLQKIRNMGHFLGLHYDEARYPEIVGNVRAVADCIKDEIRILETATGIDIDTVSMHRPSREILDADIDVPGVINSYGKVFFNEFKYLSDSRKRWREPVSDIIETGEYERLHILTHAFWYDETECDIHDSVLGFVNRANSDRYDDLKDNITDIDSIIDCGEVKT